VNQLFPARSTCSSLIMPVKGNVMLLVLSSFENGLLLRWYLRQSII